MITEAEAAEIEIIETQEPDFYATLLFLGMARLFPAMPLPEIRAAVLTTYADINERIATQDQT